MNEFLSLDGVGAGYGKVPVLWKVSLHVEKGEIASLIGPNGSGKTTVIKTITGTLRPRSGRILFGGTNIGGLAPHKIAALGISCVPERPELFPVMSVYENLLVASERLRGEAKASLALQKAYDLFPVLKERRNQRADTLSGGEQQMLSIARSLISNPSLLILDEPFSGLAPRIVRELFMALRAIREGGTTILLAEQNPSLALRLSDRSYLLEGGRILFEGTPEEMLKDERIKSTYLGL